jgi:DNA-binding NarL/FixJ family response regulator
VSELNKTRKIFIVDDHPVVRQGLNQLIAHDPDLVVCGEADNTSAALQAIALEVPDILILDLSLHDEDGFGLIDTIRRDYPGIMVLVLTLHDETFHAERALRAGAFGYLTKQEASEKVLAAIRSLLSGQMYVSERISPGLVERLLGGATLQSDSIMDRLSDRECQVFEMIGHGKSVQEIADELDLSVKTIETYRGQILKKLFLKNSLELTRYAVRWVVNKKTPSTFTDF